MMKKLIILLTSLFFFFSCEKAPEEEVVRPGIFPTSFGIDIPNSLNSEISNSQRIQKSTETIDVLAYYEALRYYAVVGESNVEDLQSMTSILNNFVTEGVGLTTFQGDDGRTKTVVVKTNVKLENKTWEYEATIKDQDNGKTAVQMVWNTAPVEGFAVISSFNLDQTKSGNFSGENTLCRIDYSEKGSGDYSSTMTVQLTNAIVENELHCEKFKLFVGQSATGEVEIISNNHLPELKLDSGQDFAGVNFILRGRSHSVTDVAVLQVCFPPSSVSTTTNLFEDYSIYQTHYIKEGNLHPSYSEQELIEHLESILFDYETPAYFSSTKFLGAGAEAKPNSLNNTFIDLNELNPFIPSDIRDLEISFVK